MSGHSQQYYLPIYFIVSVSKEPSCCVSEKADEQLCYFGLYGTVVPNSMDKAGGESIEKEALARVLLCPPVINAEAILVWKTVRQLEHYFDVEVISSSLQAYDRVDEQMTWSSAVAVARKHAHLPQGAFTRKAGERAMGLIADEQYLWAVLGKVNPSTCDVIYSRSHPGASHIAAYRIKRKLHKPWVAQFSDPWANNPYHKNHTLMRKTMDSRWERLVVENADVLIFPTEEIADMYRQAYASFGVSAKSVVLPHHYTPELYPEMPSRDTAVIASTRDMESENRQQAPHVSFAYFGDFYGLRSPLPFLEALRLLDRESPDVLHRMTVSFYGNIASKFSSLVQASPIPIVTDKVSYLESLKRMAKTDVLLLIDAPSMTGTNPFLASKVIDYLGAGRPIIGITDPKGTSPAILRQYGHDVIRPDDIKGIAQTVERRITESNISLTPPSEFTTQHVIGQLASIMKDLIH